MEVIPLKVNIIGAGVVGASIACYLSRRGALVRVFDAGPAEAGATANSFTWLNASYRNRRDYFELRSQSLAEFRRLDADLGGALHVRWGGTLSWDEDASERDALVQRHANWGHDIRLVDRDEIARLEPNLAAPPDSAAFAAGEGLASSTTVRDALVDAARDAGAEIVSGHAVSLTSHVESDAASAGAKDSRSRDGGVSVTGVTVNGEHVPADVVVLAAGTGCAPLLRSLGLELPVRAVPGLIAHSKPVRPLFNAVIEAPGLHMKQDPGGRILAGRDYGGSPVPNDPQAEGERLMGRVRDALRNADHVELERITIGERPTPADGHPLIGRLPAVDGVYLAVMHSGMTLAPIVGR